MRRRGGYTLIEMIVTLAIFSALLLGLGSLLWATNHAHRESTALSEVDRIAQLVMRQITRDLESAVLTGTRYHENGFVGTDSGELQGDEADRLRFITVAGRLDFKLDWDEFNNLDRHNERSQARRTDIVEVEYFLDLDDTTGEVGLYRREKVLLTTLETDEDRQWVQRQLAAEVIRFNLRYGDKLESLEDSYNSADKEDKLPKNVEIFFEIDLDHAKRELEELEDLRAAELEGQKTLGRGTFFRLIDLPIEGHAKLENPGLAGAPGTAGNPTSGSTSGSGR